jgi:hypothetical protein
VLFLEVMASLTTAGYASLLMRYTSTERTQGLAPANRSRPGGVSGPRCRCGLPCRWRMPPACCWLTGGCGFSAADSIGARNAVHG